VLLQPCVVFSQSHILQTSPFLAGSNTSAMVLAPPSITTLSASSLPRSGRLKIKGKNFGALQDSSKVKIGNLVAPVSSWSATSITAYVPEASLLGTSNVQVITNGGVSNTLSLTVTARQQSGRVKWRFQADDMYIQGRPGIGPDGTIYALGINGHLYALSPNGGLKWIFNAYGSTQSVSVGCDGTIYFAGLNTVYAINANGTLKWKVTDPAGALVDVGPTVGPDGNIFAVTNDVNKGGLGALSISPAGKINWNHPGFVHSDGTANYTKEVVFGSGQLYFCMNNLNGNSGLQALTLNGVQKWAKLADYQPAVAPDGRIYAISARLVNSYMEISSFTSQGKLIRTFFGSNAKSLTAPDVDTNGTFYTAQNYATLTATRPDGTTKWQYTDTGILGGPVVSPTNKRVIVGGYDIGAPGYVTAVNTSTGKRAWRLVLPAENGGYVRPMSRPRFSCNGAVVYMGMDVNDYAADPYTYLYAINTGDQTTTTATAKNTDSNTTTNNVENKEQLTVYPNPATDVVHVQVKGAAKITVINTAGKIMLIKNINNSGELNVSNLAAGIYYIQNGTSGNMQQIVVTH
jgi:hypothetical protein